LSGWNATTVATFASPIVKKPDSRLAVLHVHDPLDPVALLFNNYVGVVDSELKHQRFWSLSGVPLPPAVLPSLSGNPLLDGLTLATAPELGALLAGGQWVGAMLYDYHGNPQVYYNVASQFVGRQLVNPDGNSLRVKNGMVRFIGRVIDDFADDGANVLL